MVILPQVRTAHQKEREELAREEAGKETGHDKGRWTLGKASSDDLMQKSDLHMY